MDRGSIITDGRGVHSAARLGRKSRATRGVRDGRRRMILTDIKHYLMERPFASLRDIALHVDAPPDAVRGMLEKWVGKGKVAKQLATSACGSSCSKCDVEVMEIYRWQDSKAMIPVHTDAVSDECHQAPVRND